MTRARPALAALLLLGSAHAATYSDSKNGFTLTPPAGWEKVDYEGTAVVYMNPARVKGFGPNLNVIVQTVPAGTTQAQFHQGSVAQIKKYVSGGQIIQTRAVTLAGRPANEVVYTGRQGDFSLYFIAIYAVKGTSAYIVTGTTVLGQQGDMARKTRAFAASFRITR
ncbi:PsbP-related protein [Deinococcus sp.]|uniref:PsbP-related protein n=1 Tax=Deinococcus sp. TaxID=47478 RepID=UPI002869AFA1|nr:PsbP-related protein [Deinococcus sp.]